MSDQDHAKLHLFHQHGSAEEESGCWTGPNAVQSFYTNNRMKPEPERLLSSQTQETWTCRTLPNKFFRDSRRAQILLKRWNDFLSLMVFCSFVNKIRSLWGLGCSVRHLNHTYVDIRTNSDLCFGALWISPIYLKAVCDASERREKQPGGWIACCKPPKAVKAVQEASSCGNLSGQSSDADRTLSLLTE